MRDDSEEFEKLAQSCWRGEIKFDEFFLRTKDVWTAIASVLIRRWKAPTSREDVVQEMALRLWQKFQTYDPKRGSLVRYLTWGAKVKGKKHLHDMRQCNKHGTRDKNKSRYATVFSSMKGVDDGFDPENLATVAPVQERVAAVRAIVAKCRTSFDRAIVEGLVEAGGCVEVVAAKLFRGMDGKIAYRLISQSLCELGCTVQDIEKVAA